MKKYYTHQMFLGALFFACTAFSQTFADAKPVSKPPRESYSLQKTGGYTQLNLLYWRASNQGFAPAVQIAVVGSTQTYQIERMPSEWKPGFRIGLGFRSDYDGWDLTTDWTYYYNKSQRDRQMDITLSSGINNIEGFSPIFLVPSASKYLAYQATWRLNYNVIDLNLKKRFSLTKDLAIQSLVGLRNGWIYQHFTARFIRRINPNAQNLGELGEDYNKYWGIGPKAGLNSFWKLGKGLSILGKASFAALYGDMETKSKAQNIGSGGALNSAALTNSQLKNRFWQLVPTVEFGLGANWEMNFQNRVRLLCGLAWELNYWWDQLNILTYDSNVPGLPDNPTKNNQPLIMQGLTLNLGADF